MIATERSASVLDIFTALVGDYLYSMAGEEMSKDHDSTHDGGSLTVLDLEVPGGAFGAIFNVEEPLESANMSESAKYITRSSGFLVRTFE